MDLGSTGYAPEMGALWRIEGKRMAIVWLCAVVLHLS